MFNVEGCLLHTSQACEKVMLELKEVNEDAFKHIIAIPPRQVFQCLLTLCMFSFSISIF